MRRSAPPSASTCPTGWRNVHTDLNDEARHQFVVGDVLKLEAGVVHLGREGVEVLRCRRLDTEQDRAEVARRFLQVLKAGDIVVGAEQVEELAQRTRALRQTQDVILLAAGCAERPFLDLGQALEIEIAAGCQADDPLALDDVAVEIAQRLDFQRAGRLQHDALDVEHLDNGLTKTVLVDEDNGSRVVVLEHGVVEFADLGDGGAVDEIVDLVEADALAGFEAAHQARRASRFDQQDPRFRREHLHDLDDAGGKTASANRNNQEIDWFADLLQQLEADRGLTLDDVGMIERRHEAGGVLLGKSDGSGIALIEEVAFQPDIDVLASKHPRLGDLLLRCGDRHEDRARNAKMLAGVGEALGVVAGRRAHELTRGTWIRQRLAEIVEGPAQLVATHWRQVFALQVNFGTEAIAEKGVVLQRRRREQGAYSGSCGGDTGQEIRLIGV